MLSCNANEVWQKVQYDKSLADKDCITHCGEEGAQWQSWEKAQVYFDSDTLLIAFWAQLPAYWENVVIKVHNGKFRAETSGIPFEPITITFATVKQQLQLDKKHYALGDTLHGGCEIVFQYTSTDEDKVVVKGEYTFKGSICEVVREEDFDPFDEKNFMTFDLLTALSELGEPLSREQFNTLSLLEFRTELRKLFPASKDIWIEELTWNSSDTRDISDEGAERLTIWYHQTDGVHWKPILFYRWDEFMEF
jgi:hypothetical protein